MCLQTHRSRLWLTDSPSILWLQGPPGQLSLPHANLFQHRDWALLFLSFSDSCITQPFCLQQPFVALFPWSYSSLLSLPPPPYMTQLSVLVMSTDVSASASGCDFLHIYNTPLSIAPRAVPSSFSFLLSFRGWGAACFC